jgi:cytochrome c
MSFLRALLLSATVAAIPGIAHAAGDVDEGAARKLAKKSGCFKCHAIDKKKDAPPYKEIAEKYKGKPDAEDKLYTHATTNPEVEVDGKKETHDSPKSKDEKQIRNLIRWILSLA